MSFFSDLSSKAFSPVKAGSESLMSYMNPSPYSGGALTNATNDEELKKKAMPSITQLGMEAVAPTYRGNAFASSALGQQAMSGAPVFTDSSQTAVYSPQEKGKGFDLQELGRVLKSVQPTGGVQQGSSVSSGSRRGGFSYDKSLYENPLLQREFQNLYNAPLYQELR